MPRSATGLCGRCVRLDTAAGLIAGLILLLDHLATVRIIARVNPDGAVKNEAYDFDGPRPDRTLLMPLATSRRCSASPERGSRCSRLCRRAGPSVADPRLDLGRVRRVVRHE